MTVRVLKSPADKRNPDVVSLSRLTSDEPNDAWLKRALDAQLIEMGDSRSHLLLVGGNDPLSFRLRVAQSHVRHDLSPSSWSHVAFVRRLEPAIADSPTVEVSLAPSACFGRYGFPVPTNGLQEGRLAAYLDASLYPNVAILSIGVPSNDVNAALDNLKMQRSVLDVPQMILRWLAYCWGVGVPASPLADGVGLPSAAVLESAFGGNGFDLTPGLESRSSCPEAIWQAATWWHGYYEKRAAGGKGMKGAFTATHDLVPDTRYGPSAPLVEAGARPKTASGESRPKSRRRPRR
jgi:hypothetical protein